MTANRTLNLPIRRIDDLEIPAAGTWSVVRASSVARAAGRSGLRQIHVYAGRFEIGDDPSESSLRLDLDDSTLVAGAARVSPDRHGMSEWHLEGHSQDVNGHTPMALTLTYHGVFRRGVDVWAWLSGTGTIGSPGGRRGLRRSGNGDKLVFDLLFTAPDVTRIPRIDFERSARGRASRGSGIAVAEHRVAARRVLPRQPGEAAVVRLSPKVCLRRVESRSLRRRQPLTPKHPPTTPNCLLQEGPPLRPKQTVQGWGPM